MITQRTIFEIHRMADTGLSIRKIAKALNLCRKTVRRYLGDPNPEKPRFNRPSKLDPYKEEIDRLLKKAPDVSAQVIAQNLALQGYTGGKTILRDYLKTVRPSPKPRAFIRFESAPGEQMQIDWGHIGLITYGTTRRALYCMGVVEAHSRMLYLEITHCQDQQSLHRCLLNAFLFFGGTPRQIVHDNMKTAIVERDGPLMRFNDAFLAFLIPFAIDPFACNRQAPWEKGKVEKGVIYYIKQNFLPLRSFVDLADANAQAIEWRDTVANMRIHRTTGEKPALRFCPDALRPLPDVLADCRHSAVVKVHKDFSINFDGNCYTVPPWLVGKRLTLRADERSVWLFFNEKQVAVHLRSWQRRQRVELPQHREAALRFKEKYWSSHELAVLMSLGEEMKSFLENMIHSRHGIKKSVARLIELKNQYGEKLLLEAVRHATAHNAFGPDYMENILARKPRKQNPAVRLDKQELNRIHLTAPCLAEYDAFVIQRRRKDE